LNRCEALQKEIDSLKTRISSVAAGSGKPGAVVSNVSDSDIDHWNE